MTPDTARCHLGRLDRRNGAHADQQPLTRGVFSEKLANIRRALPEAARQLKEGGIEVVHVHYDGCGDSGQIESITCLGGGGKPVDLTAEVAITENQLTNLFYDLLETRHPGWEINIGGIVPCLSDWLSRIRPETWISRGYSLSEEKPGN